MIEESKKNEFWNFLTTEKNQPRPKGITIQRLAVIKPIAIESDLWLDVIERPARRTGRRRNFINRRRQLQPTREQIFGKRCAELFFRKKMNERIQADKIEMLQQLQT